MDYGLKSCPFWCNVCFARGGAAGGDVLEMTTTLDIFEPCVTKEELIQQAVDNWNVRGGM